MVQRMSSLRLLLMRHGCAASGVGIADADRTLTPEGVDEVEKAVAGLQHMGFGGCSVVSSPFVRAMETAGLVASVLSPDAGPRECLGLIPGVRPGEAFAALQEAAGRAGVIVAVTHMPTVVDLARWLVRDLPAITPKRRVALRTRNSLVDFLRPPSRASTFRTPGVETAACCAGFARPASLLRWRLSPVEQASRRAQAQGPA